MIPDQTAIWDEKHTHGDHAGLRGTPSPLALLVESKFPRASHILELGCGVGRDAVYFAESGHNVLATDSSEVVIQQNKALLPESNIKFEVLDMQKPLSSKGGFDVVFANLSLHYYRDSKTKEIVSNIATVLNDGGFFAFACKSWDDIRTKDAKEVEKNVFVAPNGHALHAFSKSYVRELLEGKFEILYLDEVEEEYAGRISGIVRCLAKKL